MSYLIDTNVLSELVKRQPSEAVTQWFAAVATEELYLSAISIGELRKGIEKMKDPVRQARLRHWLESDIVATFEDRILAVDGPVADQWGRLMASSNRSLPAADALIAATALHHQLDIVTRNTKDFDFPGLICIDPWHFTKGHL